MTLPIKWLIKQTTKLFSVTTVNLALFVHKNLKQVVQDTVKQCKNLLMKRTGNF